MHLAFCWVRVHIRFQVLAAWQQVPPTPWAAMQAPQHSTCCRTDQQQYVVGEPRAEASWPGWILCTLAGELVPVEALLAHSAVQALPHRISLQGSRALQILA